MQSLLDKIVNYEENKEPNVDVRLPIGIFPEFTRHREQLILKVNIQKAGLFKKGELYKTSIRVSRRPERRLCSLSCCCWQRSRTLHRMPDQARKSSPSPRFKRFLANSPEKRRVKVGVHPLEIQKPSNTDSFPIFQQLSSAQEVRPS